MCNKKQLSLENDLGKVKGELHSRRQVNKKGMPESSVVLKPSQERSYLKTPNGTEEARISSRDVTLISGDGAASSW